MYNKGLAWKQRFAERIVRNFLLNTPLVEKVIKPLRLVRKIKTLLALYKDPAKDENADTAYDRALKVSEEIVKPLLKKYSAYDTEGGRYRNLKKDAENSQPMELG